MGLRGCKGGAQRPPTGERKEEKRLEEGFGGGGRMRPSSGV